MRAKTTVTLKTKRLYTIKIIDKLRFKKNTIYSARIYLILQTDCNPAVEWENASLLSLKLIESDILNV